jgi:hypothetical protein
MQVEDLASLYVSRKRPRLSEHAGAPSTSEYFCGAHKIENARFWISFDESIAEQALTNTTFHIERLQTERMRQPETVRCLQEVLTAAAPKALTGDASLSIFHAVFACSISPFEWHNCEKLWRDGVTCD